MIGRILKEVKEYKTASILTPVFMMAEVIFETLIPYIMGLIINEGINGNDGKGDTDYILMMGIVMFVFALFGLMSGIGGGITGAKASTGLARNLRESMFRNIQKYSFANIDKFSTSGLVTRMTTDVTNVQNAYQMILRMCIRAPFSMIFAMAMAFYISPRIATIYLVAVIILGIILLSIMKCANKYFKEVFKKYDDLNESVQENVSAIRVVKAYVREDFETEKFHKASNNVYKMFIKAEAILSYNAPIMQFTVYTCILLISWIGAHMIVSVNPILNTGNLTSLLAYCMNILMSLMMLSMIFVMVSMSGASAKRIVEVLDEESSITNPDNPEFNIADGSVKFEHVNFKYKENGKNYVLKDINLDIKSGETIGIIGGTGSAKTSLVNLICRLYDVNEGSVKVGGKDIREYDLDTLRNNVAVVLQKNVLFSGTILDNLRWGDSNATKEECIAACKLSCADEFIEKFPDKYDTYIEQGGTNVSGGQKQRLCIARALLKKPKILILDDSTSAVDTATDAKIRKALIEEIPNTTKIIIAQRISSVQNADKIVVMENGTVNGFGTHDELMEGNEIYRDVFESQTEGSGDFDENGGEQ